MNEKPTLNKVENQVLHLIPKARGKMVSEIALLNLAYFGKGIMPFKVTQIMRDLIRNGFVYEPRESYYKRV
jgi:hypothetical protein